MLKALLLFSIMACASMHNQQLQYNLVGQVSEQKYNTMPQAGTTSKKGSPFATMIYIYTPTKIQQLENLNGAFCSQINSSLIASFVSDSLGYFRSKLNTGKYSVFVKYEGKYYIPYFSGAEWSSIFEVKENEKTLLNIQINSLTNNQ